MSSYALLIEEISLSRYATSAAVWLTWVWNIILCTFSMIFWCCYRWDVFVYLFRPGCMLSRRWKTWSKRCPRQGWVCDWRRWSDTCTAPPRQLRHAMPVARTWWQPFTTFPTRWRRGSHILLWWEESSVCVCVRVCDVSVCMCQHDNNCHDNHCLL